MLFYFAYGQSKAEDYVESLWKAYPAIVGAFRSTKPPFIGRIAPSGAIEFIEL
jgi:hypothetical protein